MSKLIEKDGKFYRKRRGVLVEIPPEWVGKVTHPQTIRKRSSKFPKKLSYLYKYKFNDKAQQDKMQCREKIEDE